MTTRRTARAALHVTALALAAVLGIAAPVNAQTAAPVPFASFTAEPDTWPAGSWTQWKAAFLKPDGRVVDVGNGDISHSEGQGYGMLLAVLANDAAAFDRMHAWTKAELFKRKDGLASWKWEPDKTPRITDPNNASDGEILIAWALVEAAERWSRPPLRAEAVALVTALDKATGIRSGFGRVMLPGVDGFSVEHRAKEEDGPVINLSYWIFPAFERLKPIAPKIDWDGYRASGYTLLRAARFGAAQLPTDWISIKDGKTAPAKGFPPTFSYNAVRLPLYLAWARRDVREELGPFVRHYDANGGKVFEYDAEKQANAAEMGGAGYQAIFALAKCALQGEQFPLGLRSVSFDRYYPATLHMLALAAARLRLDKCL